MMCFENCESALEKMRNRKQPLKVWKRGRINQNTGLIETSYDGNKVIWQKGTIAKPHRKRPPLKDKHICTAGLYFYSGNPPEHDKNKRGTIIATIKPEHIIAVAKRHRITYLEHRQEICCTEATVQNEPNPQCLDDRKQLLIERLKHAKKKLTTRLGIIKRWNEGEREEWEEAYQQMKDQLKQTKKDIKDRNENAQLTYEDK